MLLSRTEGKGGNQLFSQAVVQTSKTDAFICFLKKEMVVQGKGCFLII